MYTYAKVFYSFLLAFLVYFLNLPMSDDEGLGGLFGGVDDAVPEYPLHTVSIDRLTLAKEGYTYDYYTAQLDQFDNAAAQKTDDMSERLTQLQPPPLQVSYRDKRHSLWGHRLWNAAKYLVKRMDERLIDVRGKSVIELGAGLGVPSLVAYRNGASLTVVTDYPDTDLLDVIALNVASNCTADLIDADVRAELGAAALPTRCITEPLLWGKKEHIDKVLSYTPGGSGFDIVILSDVLFNHVCNDDLADTLTQLLSKSSQACGYCVFSHHRAYKQLHDFEFFDMCVRRGLAFQQIDEQDYPMMFPEDRGPVEVRQPVKCYRITRRSDGAGFGIDVQQRFDVVIQGTGLVHSLLSAALSRCGVKVLHCDGESHYAGAMVTLNDDDFLSYLTQNTVDEKKAAVQQGTTATPAPHVVVNRMEELPMQIRRRYLIDLLPVLYMCRGPIVRQLLGSDMSRTLEFQHVHRFLFLSHDAVQGTITMAEVPLTRAGIFSSDAIGLMEKRRMMHFVKDVEASVAEQLHAKTANPSDDPQYPNTSAAAALAAAQASAGFAQEAADEPSATLVEVLQRKYCLSGAALDVTTLMGMMDIMPPACAADTALSPLVRSVDMVRDLLLSVGAFHGRTPYLVSSYGSAELAQGMCRTSAVWGGIFALRRSVQGVAVDEVKQMQYAVLSNGQWVPAKVVVCPPEVQQDLRLQARDWLLDFEREKERGNAPLCPPDVPAVAPAPPQKADEQRVEEPAPVRFSRVVVVTRTQALISWAAVEKMGSAVSDVTDYTAAAPVVTALVREPVTEAVVVVLQQSHSCDQAPAKELTTSAEVDGACVIHFTADADKLSQVQLEAYVLEHYLTRAEDSISSDTTPPPATCRVIPWEDVLLCTSFTLDSRDVVARSQVPHPVDIPSETRQSHPYAVAESIKLRQANEHDCQSLVRSEHLPSAHESKRDAAAAESPTYTSAVDRASAACRNSEHYRIIGTPTLLPNLLYDGEYLRHAESLFNRVIALLDTIGGGVKKERIFLAQMVSSDT